MDISDEQTKKIHEIGQRYRLKLMLLYGSHARGQERGDSDIDIAVLGQQPLELNEELSILQDLKQLFGTDEVDVKSMHGKSILFTYQVARDSKLLYGNQLDYTKFKVFAVRQYQDAWDIFSVRNFLVKKWLGLLPPGDYYCTYSGHKFYV